MRNTIFTGVGTALVTPMKKDGSVNFEKLRELVDFQIQNGISAIISCGTTGESSTLDTDEHVQVIRETVEVAAGRVPVIAGTGSNDTRYGLELSQEAQQLGADALLMVSPYYNKTSQAGLIAHYTYIADRISLPIILYNVPSRTGINIQPETYAALADHPNIVAIKEAGGDISAALRTAQLCHGRLDLYSGNDEQTIPLIAVGGTGVISVFANMAPGIMSAMCSKALAGDFEGARRIQYQYLDIMEAMFCDVNPIPIKEAMNLMGMEVGDCRLPLVCTSGEKREKIRACLKEADLL